MLEFRKMHLSTRLRRHLIRGGVGQDMVNLARSADCHEHDTT